MQQEVEDFRISKLKKENTRLMEINERLRSTLEKGKKKLKAI
jgi:hypothetical protein